jgi:hypothetical protein
MGQKPITTDPNMPRLYKGVYRVDTTRLKDWDYTNDGYYYVTICTKNNKCYFGKIRNGRMYLNKLGKIVQEEWITG